jgi:hypothetical protein
MGWSTPLAGTASPHSRPLLAERGIGEGLQRLVQRRELSGDAQQVLARVEVAVEGVHLLAETVEALEQRVELPVSDFLAIHRVILSAR